MRCFNIKLKKYKNRNNLKPVVPEKVNIHLTERLGNIKEEVGLKGQKD